jgi:hypothetical protein
MTRNGGNREGISRGGDGINVNLALLLSIFG